MRLLILSMVVLTFLQSRALAREWSDITGEHRVEADFVELQEHVAVFRMRDGKVRRCKLSYLSADDQKLVVELESTTAPVVDEAQTGGQLQVAVYRNKISDHVATGSQPVRGGPAVKVAARAAKEKAENDGENRRCTFLGRYGSFTVIGGRGTASYILGNDKYIADLVSAGEDQNWWLYRPVTNGDPSTTMWAFARTPRCGRYNVLRFSNGAWRQFERTNGWGIGLGGSGGVAAAAGGGPSNQELLDALNEISDKLKLIQPGAAPSLQDLKDRIEAAR